MAKPRVFDICKMHACHSAFCSSLFSATLLGKLRGHAGVEWGAAECSRVQQGAQLSQFMIEMSGFA